MLEIKNLRYSINHVAILKGLDLKVEPGQYFALAGENGAGKTTMIKIVLNLIKNIQSGEVTIHGRDHHQVDSRDQLSYLPERFDIKKAVNGWQYLKFVFGAYQKEINSGRVLSLCDQFCFDSKRLHDRASTYSKGMRQKLGLISCFMLDKPLVILDEPLSGLDPKARYYFKQLLQREREFGRTIFYSTHQLSDAEEICDRFGILHDGEMKYQGTPADCMKHYQAPTLEKAYMACISN